MALGNRATKTELVRPRRRARPNPVLLRAIYAAIREDGCGLELACQSEGVDPADFEQWMHEDESIRRRVVRELAGFERSLIRHAKAGGKTMCQSRASLELLSRISTRYTHKTTVNVKSSFEAVLNELQKQLPEETCPTCGSGLEKVLGIIEAYAK